MERQRHDSRLAVVLQDKLCKSVPECLHSGFLLELKMMEVVMTTGAIRRAELQSNRHLHHTIN